MLSRIKSVVGGGSSDSSSKEITIDDVVKFIHDNSTPLQFPYTKYDDIPELPTNSDIDSLRGNIYRTSSMNKLLGYDNEFTTIFRTFSYIIVFINIGTNIGTVG